MPKRRSRLRLSTLQAALAVSVSVHAVLIGWHWADPAGFDRMFRSTPLEVILEVFKDIPSFPQWYGFCKEIRLLKQEGEDRRIIYFVLETTGPVKDRDMVIDARDTKDLQAGRALISMSAFKEDYVPRVGKYVRMTEMTGSAALVRVDADTTNVVYTVKADPAGYIPSFISNMLQKEQPYLTLKGLREMVKRDVYWERAGVARKR